MLLGGDGRLTEGRLHPCSSRDIFIHAEVRLYSDVAVWGGPPHLCSVRITLKFMFFRLYLLSAGITGYRPKIPQMQGLTERQANQLNYTSTLGSFLLFDTESHYDLNLSVFLI